MKTLSCMTADGIIDLIHCKCSVDINLNVYYKNLPV